MNAWKNYTQKKPLTKAQVAKLRRFMKRVEFKSPPERSFIRVQKRKGRYNGEYRSGKGLYLERCPFCRRGKMFGMNKVGDHCRVCATVIVEVFVSNLDAFYIEQCAKIEKEFWTTHKNTKPMPVLTGIAYWIQQP